MLKVRDVTKIYKVRDTGSKRNVAALRGVSLALAEGEILGLAGESGSGKTTLAKIITRLVPPSSGAVYFNNQDISKMDRAKRLEFHRQVQIIWQNVDSSLDPRMTVRQAITEPLIIHHLDAKHERGRKVLELLELVELKSDYKDRYPYQLSSGQRQRVVIARALALTPKLIICDEPLANIDAHLRIQLIDLLLRLRRRLRLSYLFISHDLAVLRLVSDRIAILRLGEIMETAETETFFNKPLHPYSRQLLTTLES